MSWFEIRFECHGKQVAAEETNRNRMQTGSDRPTRQLGWSTTLYMVGCPKRMVASLRRRLVIHLGGEKGTQAAAL